MNEKDIAIKNKTAYLVDTIKIISGVIITILLIAVVLIFRNSVAFRKGPHSLLDFTLLFLILSVGLFSNGIKNLYRHKKMPEIMLTNHENKFFVLGNEISYDRIKSLKGKHEFGHTGTIILATDFAIYRLYGVQNYAFAINIMNDLIAKNKQDSN